jgi:fibronectin type III domain protein
MKKRYSFVIVPVLILILCGLAFARGPIPDVTTQDAMMFYYGAWDTTKINEAKDYKIVILHTYTNPITPAQIDEIKRGTDGLSGTSDDVLVFGYVSVGEDDRATPATGDATGPRVDPRPSGASDPLSYIEDNNAWLGDASPGGTGYASYYLDDADGDGQPDTNSVWSSYYVNAGDPAWYTFLKNAQKTFDTVSGFDELLTSGVGAGYDLDGVFLDTVDTAAPNSWGTPYEWTSPGMQSLVEQISTDYPGKYICANRGLFFFSPDLKTYAYTIRTHINMDLWESYYTDSSDLNTITPFFDDNKHNFAPKVNAEADRADGFTMLVLGYDQPASLADAVKEQEIVETIDTQGWLNYRTTAFVDNYNHYVKDRLSLHPDSTAPEWDSTAASGPDSDPGTPGNQAPTPRSGVQEVIAGAEQVTVRWDVARDATRPVKYNIYYTDTLPFNFGTATKLSNVNHTIPANYLAGAGVGIYAYEYTVTGLAPGETYHFAVRAEDSASTVHEETNTNYLTATPTAATGTYQIVTIDGTFTEWQNSTYFYTDPDDVAVDALAPDYGNIRIANTNTDLFLRFDSYHGFTYPASNHTLIFFDTDSNTGTGFDAYTAGVVGSEVMLYNDTLYDEDNGGFNEGSLGTVTIQPQGASVTEIEVSIPRSVLDGRAPGATSGVSIWLTTDSNNDRAPDAQAIFYEYADESTPVGEWSLY